MTFTGLFLIQFLKTPALIPNADFVKTIYGVLYFSSFKLNLIEAEA